MFSRKRTTTLTHEEDQRYLEQLKEGPQTINDENGPIDHSIYQPKSTIGQIVGHSIIILMFLTLILWIILSVDWSKLFSP